VSKASLVTVLAEDERHVQLICRYLYRLDYSRHEIRVEPLPGGRGCGEVRQRYVRAVKAFRGRAARARTAFVVAIDADRGNVERRLQQFRESLRHEGAAPRADGEAIAHLVPKRSVETWILCLSGKHVNAETDYWNEAEVDGLIRTAAETFFHWSRPNTAPPTHCVDSLRLAFLEVQRLE
jgi:hypothetical protein